MTAIADRIDWKPEYRNGYNLAVRYHYWKPVAGFAQDRTYEFDIVATFWDPLEKVFKVGHTSGCSCPAPWDEDQTEIKTATTAREALRYMADFAECNRDYPTTQIMEAALALRVLEEHQND